MARCIISLVSAHRTRGHRSTNEDGQVLILFVLLIPVLLGMAALAIDVGGFASDRSTLQHAADSIAIAAAQELPDDTQAQSIADQWAAKNNINPADMTVTVTTSTDGIPKVTVEIARQHEFVFSKVLGIDDAEVGARAVAIKSSFGGSGLIVPWAVPDELIDASDNGDLITMKYDSNGGSNGNFGAIRLDGEGAETYEESAKHGSTSTVCSVFMPGCDAGDCPGVSCAETAPECDGASCKPKTGNMTGPTRNAVDYRMTNTVAACDTFEETFRLSGGIYRLNPQCNPFTTDGEPGSLRVILIPIIDEFGNGSSDDLEIQGFGLMFLEGYDNGKCQGNSCEVKGRFIKNSITIPGLTGSYDPDASVQVWRLVE